MVSCRNDPAVLSKKENTFGYRKVVPFGHEV